MFPDRVDAPFSVDVSARTWGLEPGASLREFSATAVRAESPEAFRDAVARDACGVAFHAITIAEGVARAATTLYLPRGRVANQVWISVYRNQGGKWVQLQVPSDPIPPRPANGPNLFPTFNRNYGAEHPLKILRLDLTMERIRVDPKASHLLQDEHVDDLGTAGPLDASDVRLFERYKRSDSPAVRYTAEYESVRLGGPPDLQLWLDTLARETGSPYQAMAQQVLAGYASREIEKEGRELTGGDRDRLVAAAVNPEAVDRRLLPQKPPRAENIRRARASRRFALIDTVFGSGPLGTSGYSMLFEHRGKRWVFLCVVQGWIS